MKIRMLQSLAGDGWTVGPGDIVVVPNDEAIRLIDAGFAVPDKTKDPETMVWGLPTDAEVA